MKKYLILSLTTPTGEIVRTWSIGILLTTDMLDGCPEFNFSAVTGFVDTQEVGEAVINACHDYRRETR